MRCAVASVRLSTAEYERVKVAAEDCGQTLSRYLREVILTNTPVGVDDDECSAETIALFEVEAE